MRKLFISILAILSSCIVISAQDARQRTTQTIVSDVLAAMPAQNGSDFQTDMADLAASAPESIEILGKMLRPAVEAKNARTEYAIAGLVSYVSVTPGFKNAVICGLKAAIEAQNDSDAKAFLNSQLRLLEETPSTVNFSENTVTPEKEVLKAIRSNNRNERMMGLEFAPTDDAFASKLVKSPKAKGAESEILYWLGINGKASQMDYILKNIDGKYSDDAIRAAATIGGEKAADKLCSLLSTDKASKAVEALKYFKGDISLPLESVARNADAKTLKNVINVAESRHVTSIKPYAVKSHAYSSLKSLVSASDADEMAVLLDNASSSEDIKALSSAYVKAVSYSDNRYSDIMGKIGSAQHPGRFYKALASVGSDEAVDYLSQKYWEGHDALNALSTMNNSKASDVILDATTTNESYLPGYLKLVSSSKDSKSVKAQKFADVLKVVKSNESRKLVINQMAGTPVPQLLPIVDKYIDDPELSYVAARAARIIILSNPTLIDKDEMVRIGNRITKVLQSTGKADDEYARTELWKVINAQKSYPVSELTAEEKAMGFKMLYDGTTLDKWKPCPGYRSVNGVINVTANYGGEGNLYTLDEYQDFIFRFEFCFLEEGVNNGVGIRTPDTGVDAAYHAMCELQILDHDAPMYAGLNDYQVHGSAYGIIPAKRLKHKSIGEWSEEEIIVKGTHIKVTVNGEVILDGDLKEACQGHNVAPDGGSSNPYTVDHKNHPGMFIEKGHISFCGHGNGLQFRNIRVLSL